MDNQTLIKELYAAISHSVETRVHDILSNNPSLLKTKTPVGSWLHVAAMRGNVNIVKYLIKSGLDVNSNIGLSGSMPISCAASKGYLEIVQYLLDNGAILDVSEPERNPLFSAIPNGHLEIV
jgi:ankyrin repeat protein